VRHTFATTVLVLGLLAFETERPIDRRALVTRHVPVLKHFDPESPLSVGNGELAFTADVTGLQTFAEAYEETIPLGTLAQWGWHTSPNPNRWTLDAFGFTPFESHGRRVGYADIPGDRRTPEIEWLRGNPHRLHLGRIGFRLTRRDGRPAAPQDLTEIEQTLDLWNGVLVSRFTLDGDRVEVETLCHPRDDQIAVRVRSTLVGSGRLGIEIRFPYGTGQPTAADWSQPEAHTTALGRPAPTSASFARRLDSDSYLVRASWSPAATLIEAGAHTFLLTPEQGSPTLELVAAFSPGEDAAAPHAFEQARTAAKEHWNDFWSSGGAIDLSGSTNPRWRELERRIVLSQYLNRHPVCRPLSSSGDRAHVQQLGGKVPPRDALVARGAVRAVESSSAARQEPWVLRVDPAARTPDRASPGIPRGSLAENDVAVWRRVAVEHRTVPRMAAAASDLLCRARLSRAGRSRDARAFP
jgi:hypothetical protein